MNQQTDPMNTNIESDQKIITDIFDKLPKIWNGQSALEEMKRNHDPNWKQMEWIGFYAEYLFNRQVLNAKSLTKGGIYGNTKFDYSRSINWDLKAHPNSTPGAILNDCDAIDESLREFKVHGLIIVCMDCEYDLDGSFKKWHDELKGGTSKYENDRVKRGAPSRKRKIQARITDLKLILINSENISRLSTKQKGWRNSNGKERKGKYYISNAQIHNWNDM